MSFNEVASGNHDQSEVAAKHNELSEALQSHHAECDQLDCEICAEQWPNIPTTITSYVMQNGSGCVSAAMQKVQKLLKHDPAALTDPELMPLLLDDIIATAKLQASRSESNKVAILDDQADQKNISLKEKISGNLSGPDKAGQLAQLILQVETSDDFSPTQKKATLKHLQEIATTFAQMTQAVSSETGNQALATILANVSLNLGTRSMASTFASAIAEIEKSPAFTDEEKYRLRAIVTGSDAQATLDETITNTNGTTNYRFTKQSPRDFGNGRIGYASPSGRHYLELRPGDSLIKVDITGWHGENVGQILEVYGFINDLEECGLTGWLKSIYHTDFSFSGDAGLTPDKLTEMNNIMGLVLGGFTAHDGKIMSAGERQGYLRYFARLHNPKGTATGFENSQAQTDQVIKELGYRHANGSPNWVLIKRAGEFARATYLSGDASYNDLKSHLAK